MKRLLAGLVVVVVLGFSQAGIASIPPVSFGEVENIVFWIDPDATNDHAGGRMYATHGIGHAVQDGFLYVVVQTNFPQAGLVGNDSYGSGNHFRPGDLYINLGGMFQQGTADPGKVFGVGTTTHGNVVSQAYGGEVWTPTIAGSLYEISSPAGTRDRNTQGTPYTNGDNTGTFGFATGTFERYENTEPEIPTDGNPGDGYNDYPSLIRSGTLVPSPFTSVLYHTTGNGGTTALGDHAFEIYYRIWLGDLFGDKNPSGSVQLFWTMECGNDGVTKKFDIPEPTTVALVTAGLVAVGARSRRRRV